MTLILASTSPIRAAMLSNAGVAFESVPPGVDETLVKGGSGDFGTIAQALAAAKSLRVSEQRPEDWVIGSDSVVEAGGRTFSKPVDRAEAAEHLRFFSGRPLRLTSAVALAHGGAVVWHHQDSAELHVRALSDPFIETYLSAEWPDVAYCVGVFRMEGRGVQLFDRVEGSHFTILGMPLLPLLGALRDRGLLQA